MKKMFYNSWVRLGALGLLTLMLIFAYNFYQRSYAPKALTNPILEAAEEYKMQTGSYGIVSNPQFSSCVERSSFLVTDKVRIALEKPSVTNISCRFELNGNTIKDWSVSIIEGERVTCIDSSGFAQVTPGITMTPRCSGE